MQDKSISPGKIHQQSILFCVLDWGLGHATRSSVLIAQLLKQNNRIVLVSSGTAAAYLKIKFPKLQMMEIEGLNMRYYRYLPAWLSIGLQFYKLRRRINIEQDYIANLLNEQSFDVLLSDSCYGAYHSSIPSILISHQLYIQTKFFTKVINHFYAPYLLPFHAIWVPDFADKDNLSGQLAHNLPIHLVEKNILYIQPICRFETLIKAKPTIAYLFILSGPEPLRSNFEAAAFQFCNAIQTPTSIVRGTNSISAHKENQNNPLLKVYNMLEEDELGLLLASAKVVVCRSGYSSIMDYWRLPIVKYLLPTLGQSEQVYLAQYLNQRYGFKSISNLTEIMD